MMKLRFRVPLYGFDVTLVQTEGVGDKDGVLSLMRGLRCPREHMDIVSEYLDRGSYDGGDTFYNFRSRSILVVFYGFRTEGSRYEVYSHEKRHVEDRILEHMSVHDIESAALLAGFLGRKFYEFCNIIKR